MPSVTPLPVLDAATLRDLAQRAPSLEPCGACESLVCPGWETLSASVDRNALVRVATLRQPADEAPTLTEFHPDGTHGWDAHAPIAPAYFPYNLCEVWQCKACARPFLRYTEYGGYYVDERVRALRPDLVVGAG
jgi:hypothetical protein